jgi:hypothetical protein
MEAELHVADLDLIPIDQFGPTTYPLAINKSAVAASQILHEIRAVILENLRMVSADSRIVKNDVAAGMPTQHHAIPVQFNNLSGATPLDDLQNRHAIPFATESHREDSTECH